MQGHVAVVVELAQRHPQPPPIADAHNGVGLQGAQLAHPDAGAGEQLQDESSSGVGLSGDRPGQAHRVAVVEELRQWLIGLGQVVGVDRRAGRPTTR